MPANDNNTLIKIMRTSLDVTNNSIKDKIPLDGEMLYLKYPTDATNNGKSKWLMIGDGATTTTNLYVFKATSQANSTKYTFFRDAVSSQIVAKYLSDEENAQTIYPYTDSQYVKYNSSNVKTELDSIINKRRALSDVDGGSSTYSKVVTANANTKYYITGVSTATTINGDVNAHSLYKANNSAGTQNNTGIYFNGSTGVLYGAAWNDFAEFRKCKYEPGTCVIENGDGTLSISKDFHQGGAYIVSDTYGMVIGAQDDSTSPVAVAGRVLAKPFLEKTFYVPGAAVTTAPNGTVTVMSREDIKEYPDRIVGYVSEIPQYEEWNGIKVNNRIWIKVK